MAEVLGSDPREKTQGTLVAVCRYREDCTWKRADLLFCVVLTGRTSSNGRTNSLPQHILRMWQRLEGSCWPSGYLPMEHKDLKAPSGPEHWDSIQGERRERRQEMEGRGEKKQLFVLQRDVRPS